MVQGHSKTPILRPANNNARVAKKTKAKKNQVSSRFTSGLISKTEEMLSRRAGHMEILGRKGKPAAKGKKGKKAGDTLVKGGSRNFG